MKNYWKKISARYKVYFSIILLCIMAFTFFSFEEKDFKIAKNLDIFVSLFKEVNLNYVDEKDPEDLINASIQGMLESLDPYTNYIPQTDMDEFKFMTTGQYGGIGALIRKAGNYAIITEPYEGSPALKVGLRAGDTLISINGISARNKSISDVSEMLKGTPNTELKIMLKRPFKDTSIFEKSFLRENITIKNVPYFGFVADGIGYIRLTGFTKDASKEVRKAFGELKSQGAKSLILDLRGNPGGLLVEAVDIANIWINKGQEIVSTRGKDKQQNKVYKTEKLPEDTTMNIAVLVNRGSASASEIVSGSLQDLDRAILVGQRTFGKGLVQTTLPLSYNTYLKITTAKYYIPSGRCIQALDYTHRNPDGSVGYIPDSLISEFKTKNGRLVYDGGGIKPDIDLSMPQPANISISLYNNNLIFDFATEFAAHYDSIPTPDKFIITDAIYTEFIKFLKNKDFDYNTSSNDKLDELIESAKSEGYYTIAKNEIDALHEKLGADKNKDLQTFKPEIKNLLMQEIICRYYYQTGRIITELKDDPQLDKAIALLKEPNSISSILHGTFTSGNIKLAVKN
jgi:carboxyl-terminal processing protease